MIRIEHHHYVHFDESDSDKILKLIFNQNKSIMENLTALKEKLFASDQKIDILTTATTGIRQDLIFIKKKLDENKDGIDAKGVAELAGIIENQNARLATVAQNLADLDAETDSSEPAPDPEPQPEEPQPEA
jgi:hypothetical protein